MLRLVITKAVPKLFISLAFIIVTHVAIIKDGIASDDTLQVPTKLIKHYSQAEHWHSLLHYNNGKTRIKDPNFFLSPLANNIINPEKELIKTIEGFFNKKDLLDSHPICKYPARFKWIKKVFSFEDKLFPDPSCHEFTKYYESISPKAIKIAFASESVKNPTSMMGHPFLKIEGSKNGKDVDHALTYFGDYGNENIFKFYY